MIQTSLEDTAPAAPAQRKPAAYSLWGNLPDAVWVARCAVEMRQIEPSLDPADARELSTSLLEDARTALTPAELECVNPEEAARRYAAYGWVDFWPADTEAETETAPEA